MDIQSLLSGVALGKDTSGNFKPSIKGLAVRRPDGKFVVHDGQQMLDVSDLTLDGADNFIYRLPMQSVKQGDVIITSDSPFSVLFVQDVSDNGKLSGLDPHTNTVVEYIPPANLLNIHFFVKVVSLLDGLAGDMERDNLLPLLLLNNKSNDGLTTVLLMQALGGTSLDSKNLLPLLLLLGNKNDSNKTGDSLTTLLLLQTFGGKALDSNSMLLLLLLGDNKSDGLETLLLMQALEGNKNPLTGLLGHSSTSSDSDIEATALRKSYHKA